MKRSQKRIYLINRDFQLRYAWLAAFVGIISTILTGAVLLYPLYEFEILRVPRFLPWPILLGMGLAAFLNIMLIALLGIFITHRIAGPAFSLVRAFRRLEMGKWNGRLRIRDEDELHFVVRNFNQMVDALVLAAKADLQSIGHALELLEKNPQEAKSELSKLQKIVEHRTIES